MESNKLKKNLFLCASAPSTSPVEFVFFSFSLFYTESIFAPLATCTRREPPVMNVGFFFCCIQCVVRSQYDQMLPYGKFFAALTLHPHWRFVFTFEFDMLSAVLCGINRAKSAHFLNKKDWTFHVWLTVACARWADSTHLHVLLLLCSIFRLEFR